MPRTNTNDSSILWMGVLCRHRGGTATDDGEEGKDEDRKEGEKGPVGGAGRRTHCGRGSGGQWRSPKYLLMLG